MARRARTVFIGGGNMARSLIGGLVAAGHDASAIRITDPSAAKRSDLAGSYGVEAYADNVTAVADAEVVVLAVKPQSLAAVAAELTEAVNRRAPLIVSVAAGVRVEDLARWLGYGGPVVRCMPNTPALLGEGVTALCANERASADDRRKAQTILETAGPVIWLDDEALMDIVTAVSGSGPAYFFLFMEALADAAAKRGLAAEQARLLATQTALGAARMATFGEEGPGELREKVTSKGGTTAEALAVFDQLGLATLVDRAVEAAASRARELGDELGAN
jgi:pyrroline-5-carboxylate reductase